MIFSVFEGRGKIPHIEKGLKYSVELDAHLYYIKIAHPRFEKTKLVSCEDCIIEILHVTVAQVGRSEIVDFEAKRTAETIRTFFMYTSNPMEKTNFTSK